MKVFPAIAAFVLGAALAAPAQAQRHHHGPRVTFGFHFGVPLGYYHPYPYYYHPYYYYPPVVVQPSPPVYVERGESQPAPAQEYYWYYCADAKMYYPYVKQCPGGWQRVSPQPQE
jgi:hypothetical protein